MRWLTGKNASEALLIESVAAGLAFAALLCWGSTCLVASFRPYALAAPYWAALPGLRTDTSGAIAFLVAAVCITVSEYLRLRRRRTAADAPFGGSGQADGSRSADRGKSAPMAQAVSKAIVTLSTGLVAYLSLNAVTHPATLEIQATHLLPWPTEGTLRIAALVLCVASVGVRRFLQAEEGRAASAA